MFEVSVDYTYSNGFSRYRLTLFEKCKFIWRWYFSISQICSTLVVGVRRRKYIRSSVNKSFVELFLKAGFTHVTGWRPLDLWNLGCLERMHCHSLTGNNRRTLLINLLAWETSLWNGRVRRIFLKCKAPVNFYLLL